MAIKASKPTTAMKMPHLLLFIAPPFREQLPVESSPTSLSQSHLEQYSQLPEELLYYPLQPTTALFHLSILPWNLDKASFSCHFQIHLKRPCLKQLLTLCQTNILMVGRPVDHLSWIVLNIVTSLLAPSKPQIWRILVPPT